MGGNETFWYVPDDQVVEIPLAENGYINQDIIMAPDATFFQGYASLNTLIAEDDPQDTDQGLSFPVSITFRVPKDVPEILFILQNMMRQRHIVLKRDNNGLIKLYGKPDQGLNFRYRTLNPGEAGGYNGYEGEFFRTYDEPCWFYGGQFIVNNETISSPYLPGVSYTVGGYWLFGTANPPGNNLGKNGDGYFNYITQKVYEKQGNTWIEIGYLGPDQELEEFAYLYTSLAITGNLI